MGRIVVLGAGPVGLAVALMLGDQGHDVTVLERDRDEVPGSASAAWESWDRPGVAQLRQPHILLPGARQILDSQLPDLAAALRTAEGLEFDFLSVMPPTVSDRAPREGDDRFLTLTARRPVVDYAFGTVAADRVEVRRGVEVAGLAVGSSAAAGVPHVSGVRLATGEVVSADLVLDVTGRRSKLPAWLAEIGARPPIEESEDLGFAYYTRFFRARSSQMPQWLEKTLTPIGSISVLTIPSDAQTWSVTVYVSSHDHALKALRDTDRWSKVVAACPRHAHWLDGEPISDVAAFAGATDRYRRLVVDGAPVATGVLAIGDAWACTNPSLGRGITFGLMHAAAASEVVAEHLNDPLALASTFDEITEARLTPWHHATTAADRVRSAQIYAEIDGVPEDLTDGTQIARAFPVAAGYDADIFRAFFEIAAVLTTPEEVLARPGLPERILDVAGNNAAPIVGPTRSELLHLIA